MTEPTESVSLPVACEVCGEFFHAEARWFDEGHDPRCDEEGRHLHFTDPMAACPECKSGVKQLSKRVSIESSGVVWSAVLGNLGLAMRHPNNNGPSRELVHNFVENLGSRLEEEGILSPNQLRKIWRLEVEAGNEDFRHLIEPGVD